VYVLDDPIQVFNSTALLVIPAEAVCQFVEILRYRVSAVWGYGCPVLILPFLVGFGLPAVLSGRTWIGTVSSSSFYRTNACGS